MLVLSRQRDESIVCPLNREVLEKLLAKCDADPEADLSITVTIVDIRGDKVRLGVEATKEIPVHRDEVWAHIQREGGKKKFAIATN